MIRQATSEDAPSLSALSIHVFLDTYATDGLRPDLVREVFAECSVDAFLPRLSADSQSAIHVAEVNHHLVGFSATRIAATAPVEMFDEGLELVTLYVLPRFHGRGVGQQLLDAAESEARDANLPSLWLTVWAENAKAIGFYKRRGLDVVGRTAHVFEDKVYENLVMGKKLA